MAEAGEVQQADPGQSFGALVDAITNGLQQAPQAPFSQQAAFNQPVTPSSLAQTSLANSPYTALALPPLQPANVGSTPFQRLEVPQQQAAGFIPGLGALAGGQSGIGKAAAAIKQIESGGRRDAYTIVTNAGKGRSATGAYQFLDTTWTGEIPQSIRGNTTRASNASPGVQDRAAQFLMNKYFQQFGDWNLVAIAWHAGPGTARKVQSEGRGALAGKVDVLGGTTSGYLDKFGRLFAGGR